ncbi:protein kinase [Candidatus Woesearchaeota archaeon]|nr:protein kinase [Candidatus Woesearchaeota archaeon]
MKDVLYPGDKLDGRYVVVSHFKYGTFGPLYVIENLRGGAKFILKVNLPLEEMLEGSDGTINPGAAQTAKINHIGRTLKEVETTAKFNHPNIIKVIEWVDFDKYKGIVYERIEDVKTLEEASGKLSMGEYIDTPILLDYAHQLINAVRYINGKGYLHKDLKPKNVIVDSGITLKIIDFGCSNPIGEDNGIYGNIFYRPPEFFQGRQHPNSDLWPLAMIIAEIITGYYLLGEKDEHYVDDVYRELIGNPNQYEKWLKNNLRKTFRLPRKIEKLKGESGEAEEVDILFNVCKSFLKVRPDKRIDYSGNLDKKNFREVQEILERDED